MSNSITVRARGVNGQESVSLQVGGTTVQTWTLTTAMQDYTASTSLTGEIRVAFTNDATGRDVQVDYIVVNGQTRQAENQSVNTGVWANNQCGGSGNSEWLHCNGYISFGNVS
uniref:CARBOHYDRATE BINDING MODULE n=1 Tax=Escherichia coli TaxID=562 RepID=UPI0001D63BC7|nr:Chain A, Carbohydrate Binding Module [Escherichia coli]2XFE_A Chain A, Carbohydrate Binding Module [Escherichia coli]